MTTIEREEDEDFGRSDRLTEQKAKMRATESKRGDDESEEYNNRKARLLQSCCAWKGKGKEDAWKEGSEGNALKSSKP